MEVRENKSKAENLPIDDKTENETHIVDIMIDEPEPIIIKPELARFFKMSKLEVRKLEELPQALGIYVDALHYAYAQQLL